MIRYVGFYVDKSNQKIIHMAALTGELINHPTLVIHFGREEH
jgi:hypothetical protein